MDASFAQQQRKRHEKVCVVVHCKMSETSGQKVSCFYPKWGEPRLLISFYPIAGLIQATRNRRPDAFAPSIP
jgi:hypothetical protein